MRGFSFTRLLVSLPSAPRCLPSPPFPFSPFASPPACEWEGEQTPFREHCFQSSHVSSTLAQFALRSVSWSGAPGSPPTIIDLAYSSASPVSPFPHTGLCSDKLFEDLLWC